MAAAIAEELDRLGDGWGAAKAHTVHATTLARLAVLCGPERVGAPAVVDRAEHLHPRVPRAGRVGNAQAVDDDAALRATLDGDVGVAKHPKSHRLEVRRPRCRPPAERRSAGR